MWCVPLPSSEVAARNQRRGNKQHYVARRKPGGSGTGCHIWSSDHAPDMPKRRPRWPQRDERPEQGRRRSLPQVCPGEANESEAEMAESGPSGSLEGLESLLALHSLVTSPSAPLLCQSCACAYVSSGDLTSPFTWERGLVVSQGDPYLPGPPQLPPAGGGRHCGGHSPRMRVWRGPGSWWL